MAYAEGLFRNKMAPSALVALGLEAGIGVLAFVMLTHSSPFEKPAPKPVEITLEKAPEIQPESPKPEPLKPQPQKPEPPKPQKMERVKPQPMKTRPIAHPQPPRPLEQTPQPVANDQSAFATPPALPVPPPEPARQPVFDASMEAKLLDEFQAKAREAIQAVMRYPAIARTLKTQGRVKVEFDYVGGVVGNAHVTGSSGHDYFDQAALEALAVAVLPPMPPELVSKFRHLSINLDFYYRP